MPKIVTVEQMRAIEKAADAGGHSYAAMMQHAGGAVANRICALIGDYPAPRVVVLVGPGNNGGDGLVVARLLQEQITESHTAAYLLKPRSEDDDVFTAARDAGVEITQAADDPDHDRLRELIQAADVIVDALFGTSLRLPLKGEAARILQTVRATLDQRAADRPAPPYTTPTDPAFDADADAPLIIAVDCPSGVECDTGEMDPNTIPAHETITFAAAKPGLLAFPGAAAVGTLHIGDIGLPADLPELNDITLELVDAVETSTRLPHRSDDSYKGSFGKALIVAGSLNFTGAAYLAAGAAYRVGAGWVTVGAPQVIVPILAGLLPEATWLLLPHTMGVINAAAVNVLREELANYTSLLVGPGFGTEDDTGEFLRELLNPQEQIKHSRAIGFIPLDANGETAPTATLPPLVIDADGLNLLAQMPNWADQLPPNTILTPHPGEFARLADLSISDVQANRFELARTKAAEWNCVVVLKGAFTVVATPDGRTAVQPFATSALASAGTGDVLAGAIVGLLAQGLDPYDAAVAGAWLHGRAGLHMKELFGTAASVIAGDLLDLLPAAYALAENARQARA